MTKDVKKRLPSGRQKREKGAKKASTAPGEADRLLVFVRHGIAEEKSDAKPDEDRTLTKEGHLRMKQEARALAELFPEADVIYTSPLVRCVQTALWVSKGYRSRLEPVTTEALRPEASVEDFLTFLRETKENTPILIGHEPGLSTLLAHFVGASSAGTLELKKGGCAALRMMPGGAKLELFLPPRVLRRLKTS
ncbi:MAG TPA: phosphoglycerate mutase family protein [Thermoanaerobaculia bacterium]|nr:phosphoglycerate mutase family protein [Thermoanaerobaculia bacterium]